jgi:ATP-dependent Clp protease ATP-binding subunit ClpA
LNKEIELAAERGIQLVFDDKVKEWLLARNDHPEWGARPLRRIVQRHIRQKLAELLLKEDLKRETILRVEATLFGLDFKLDSGEYTDRGGGKTLAGQ